jgi:hypothetical protein
MAAQLDIQMLRWLMVATDSDGFVILALWPLEFADREALI